MQARTPRLFQYEYDLSAAILEMQAILRLIATDNESLSEYFINGANTAYSLEGDDGQYTLRIYDVDKSFSFEHPYLTANIYVLLDVVHKNDLANKFSTYELLNIKTKQGMGCELVVKGSKEQMLIFCDAIKAVVNQYKDVKRAVHTTKNESNVRGL